MQYMLFDLLYLEGRSLMERPYEERREQLESLGLEGPTWQTPRYHRGEGAALLAASAEQGLEGVVAKRLDSHVRARAAQPAWIKVKNKQRQEARDRRLAAGEGARRSGSARCWSATTTSRGVPLRRPRRDGLGREGARAAGAGAAPLARDRSPFDGKRGPQGARYVEPRLVAEIEFTEWTNEGMLRHPSYKGLVEDGARRRSCWRTRRSESDEPDPVGGERCSTAAETTASLGPGRKVGKQRGRGEVEGRALRLSNLDKVMYPKAGFTKGDLIDYYVRIAPVLLPHLHDRPLTLKRYPDGVEGQALLREAVPVAPAGLGPDGGGLEPAQQEEHRLLPRQRPAHAGVARRIWPTSSCTRRCPSPRRSNRPTMMVFDLDPGAPADIIACCRVGSWLRDLFEQLGLESVREDVGLEGAAGVRAAEHAEVTYDDTKPFARAVAELIEKQHPKQVVSRMTKSLRGGKVLIDWSQNDDHKTTVCVYSLRAKERPTVSTPVTWDEVEAASAAPVRQGA